jgi:hypothetical protein
MPPFLMGSAAFGELRYSINFFAASELDEFITLAAAKV